MNIPKAYIGGFRQAFRSPRMILILYFANILTALILALPFMGFLKSGFANSDIISNLINDFDFTAFSNLFYYHGDGIKAILGGIKWLILIYFVISIFLTGGILRTLNKEKFTTSNFFAGAAYNFFRFLGLNLIMIAVQIIFILIVYIPMTFIMKHFSATVSSEITLYYIFFSAFTLHLLFFLFISMIGDYAKFYLVLENSFNIFKGFWKGVKYVFQNFLKTYVLYLILLFLPAVVMYLYIYIEKDIKMATEIGILIVFLLQQAFILLRVILRIWILSSQLKLYTADFIKSENVQQLVMDVETKKLEEKKPEKITETKNTEEKATEKKYQIDFDKTFATKKPTEKVLSETEMLEKTEQENSEIETSESQQDNINEDKKTDERKDDDLIELDL
ncbi:MAG: hypothetical protein JXR51_03195 [Bacteroidales bacterium]|nr:hypothetical protein [Bacteroidales bacterium]MBN2756157.1 hypothetical protein [Bacteroidales bacterium]